MVISSVLIINGQTAIDISVSEIELRRCFYLVENIDSKNKNNHLISCNSHASTTANIAIHLIK